MPTATECTLSSDNALTFALYFPWIWVPILHSPFPMYVTVLGPVSISPGGQVKVTFDPTTTGW